MNTVQLTFGAGHIDRLVSGAEALLRQYRRDTGCDYLDYESSVTPKDVVVPEDLAVTLLLNSQVGWRAFCSLRDYGASIDLASLSNKPLEQTTEEERRQVADLVATMTKWPGLGASVATKVLHKKRPALIPVLDNQAIFGAYMNRDWPQKPAPRDSVKNREPIAEPLEWIVFDITRPENEPAWPMLQAIEPSRTRIQLFDSVWWMYFRLTQPVQR